MSETVVPTIPNNVHTLRDVLMQLYQVLGAEDVPTIVLDVCDAAMRGAPIPNVDILPYVSEREQELIRLRERVGRLQQQNSDLLRQLDDIYEEGRDRDLCD